MELSVEGARDEYWAGAAFPGLLSLFKFAGYGVVGMCDFTVAAVAPVQVQFHSVMLRSVTPHCPTLVVFVVSPLKYNGGESVRLKRNESPLFMLVSAMQPWKVPPNVPPLVRC